MVHAHVGNFTTNLAEGWWMHIRSKFDGGKQINRSQGSAWKGRCAGATLRQNLGPDWGPNAWEKITGEKANPVYRAVSKERCILVERDRKRKATDQAKMSRLNSTCQKTTDNSVQARRDYARHDGGISVLDVASDVPQNILEDLMKKYYETNVQVSSSKAKELESATITQGEGDDTVSNIWKAERRKRITSSIIGQIAKRRSKTKVEKLVKYKLYSTFRGNTATRWGHEHEKHARQKYLDQLRTTSPSATCKDSGLVIHRKHHWLAASPDGLVNDPSATPTTGLVEIKNPFKFKDSTIIEAAEASDFFLKIDKNKTVHLKKTHNYYYQVQGAMFCTETLWCDFVVCTTKDIVVQRIPYDKQFWETAITKLRTFYFTALLPQLAAPLNGNVREPEQWLTDPKNWERFYSNL